MNILIIYGVTLVVFFLIDITWLAFIAPKLYRSQIGHLMSDDVNVPAAVLFYLLFIAGMVYFAIIPGLNANSGLMAFGVGAFFGLITYATYDLTNLATLKKWPVLITIIDLGWGTLLSATTSFVVFTVLNIIGVTL